MIRFEGEILGFAYKFMQRKLFFIGLLTALLGNIFLGIPTFLIFHEHVNHLFIIFLVLVYDIFVLLVSCCSIKENVPLRVEIEGNRVIGEYKNGYRQRSAENIKNVIDYGEFYVIVFFFWERWSNCICQKDLIAEGTIEEFEEIFKDKIVRKTK